MIIISLKKPLKEMSLSIIILAAGQGLRMNSEIPKVFHSVGNYPMIYHVLDLSQKLKPSSTTLVVSNKLKSFEKSLIKRYQKIKFEYQKKPLGTANAVITALNNKEIIKKKNTIILYGDTPLITYETLSKALNDFKRKKLDLSILSMIENDTNNSYGRLVFKKSKLKKIVEKSELNFKQKNILLCNSGIMLIKTKLLNEKLKQVKNKNEKREFFLTDLVEILDKENYKVSYFNSRIGEAMGVNNKTDLAKAERKFQDDMREKFLKKGVTIIDPCTVYFSKDTKIGKDVIVHPNVVFGPKVKIGNSVVIKSFSHIESSSIGDNAIVGPFVRLRDESIIGSQSKIGNFVEIKKSKIKKNVKISHLSYIGDSSIEKNTNIGAGTITCNYDGLKKNKTYIGENCFIGSNTSLIAPIKIKKDSIIGAGTVVDKNIQEGTVVYRKSQLIKKNKK